MTADMREPAARAVVVVVVVVVELRVPRSAASAANGTIVAISVRRVFSSRLSDETIKGDGSRASGTSLSTMSTMLCTLAAISAMAEGVDGIEAASASPAGTAAEMACGVPATDCNAAEADAKGVVAEVGVPTWCATAAREAAA
jgi:hypothetical protein